MSEPVEDNEELMSVPVAESVPYVATAEPTVVPAVVAPVDGELVEDDDDPGNLDSAEEKRLKRMRRNRESAAQSRNRKKQYVDSLESEIRQLKGTISNLSSENYELRKEHARLTGAPPPPPPEAVAMLAPVDVAVANAADEEASTSAAQPPIAVAASAVATATTDAAPAAPVALAAPSPRKTDALLGLELLSRSASINGKDAAEEDGEAADVMDAEAVAVAEVPAGKSEMAMGEAVAGSQSGSTASSMVLDPVGAAW